jgi:hypothetical protein
VLAHWHGLAKLRQHSDLSLDILESITECLGKALRDFESKTCPCFDTQELKRESEARRRRKAKTVADVPLSALASSSLSQSSSALSSAHVLPSALYPSPSSSSTLPQSTLIPPATSSSANPSLGCTIRVTTKSDAKKAAKSSRSTASGNEVPQTRRRRKLFNLRTYKNHSLGDYVKMIRTYGTTDSYSTELVSIGLLQHSFFLIRGLV